MRESERRGSETLLQTGANLDQATSYQELLDLGERFKEFVINCALIS